MANPCTERAGSEQLKFELCPNINSLVVGFAWVYPQILSQKKKHHVVGCSWVYDSSVMDLPIQHGDFGNHSHVSSPTKHFGKKRNNAPQNKYTYRYICTYNIIKYINLYIYITDVHLSAQIEKWCLEHVWVCCAQIEKCWAFFRCGSFSSHRCPADSVPIPFYLQFVADLQARSAHRRLLLFLAGFCTEFVFLWIWHYEPDKWIVNMFRWSLISCDILFDYVGRLSAFWNNWTNCPTSWLTMGMPKQFFSGSSNRRGFIWPLSSKHADTQLWRWKAAFLIFWPMGDWPMAKKKIQWRFEPYWQQNVASSSFESETPRGENDNGAFQIRAVWCFVWSQLVSDFPVGNFWCPLLFIYMSSSCCVYMYIYIYKFHEVQVLFSDSFDMVNFMYF